MKESKRLTMEVMGLLFATRLQHRTGTGCVLDLAIAIGVVRAAAPFRRQIEVVEQGAGRKAFFGQRDGVRE